MGPLSVKHDAAAAMEESRTPARDVGAAGVLAQPREGRTLLHQQVPQPHKVKVGRDEDELACQAMEGKDLDSGRARR